MAETTDPLPKWASRMPTWQDQALYWMPVAIAIAVFIVAVVLGDLYFFLVVMAALMIVTGLAMLWNKALMEWTFMMMYSKKLHSIRSNTELVVANEKKNEQFQRKWVPGVLIVVGACNLGVAVLASL